MTMYFVSHEGAALAAARYAEAQREAREAREAASGQGLTDDEAHVLAEKEGLTLDKAAVVHDPSRGRKPFRAWCAPGGGEVGWYSFVSRAGAALAAARHTEARRAERERLNMLTIATVLVIAHAATAL